MSPRKLLRDTMLFTATQYVVRMLMMLRGVIAARLLSPASYGAWNALQLVLDYGANAPLGTQQGLDQAVPARIVDGRPGPLRALLAGGLFNILVLSFAYAAYVQMYFTRRPGDIRDFWGAGGIALALVCVLLINVSNYHTTVLRSRGDIRGVSNWFVLQGAIGALLGLGLVPWLGAWGLLVGWAVANLVALAYARWRYPEELAVWPAPRDECVQLVRAGFPIFLYFFSTMVMRTIDRLVVLRFLGAESLGYYGIAVMVLSLLLYLPDSVSYVLYPRLLTEYRAAGDDPAAIRDRVVRVVRLVALLMPLLGGVAFLLARQLLLVLLPDYLAGASAVRVLCFAAAALALASIGSITLMTLRRQVQLAGIALLVTVFGVAANIAVLRAGFGLQGVAFATLGTYGVYGGMLLWYAGIGLRLPAARRWELLLRGLAPTVVGILLAYLAHSLTPWFGRSETPLRIARVTISELAFVGAYLLLLLPLWRGVGLRRLVSELRGGTGA